MSSEIPIFVEHIVDSAWREARALRGSLEMDFIDVVRKKRSLMNRGIPHDVSRDVEEALGALGDEYSEESWATLADLAKLPLDAAVTERRLLGPLFWKEHRELGARAFHLGSPVTDRTPGALERFGARLVSNDEMDRYVESEAFEAETRGLTDGECKLFTILAVSQPAAEAVGLQHTLDAMKKLGGPTDVRLVWTIGPV